MKIKILYGKCKTCSNKCKHVRTLLLAISPKHNDSASMLFSIAPSILLLSICTGIRS